VPDIPDASVAGASSVAAGAGAQAAKSMLASTISETKVNKRFINFLLQKFCLMDPLCILFSLADTTTGLTKLYLDVGTTSF
jgi:hypothetical protein